MNANDLPPSLPAYLPARRHLETAAEARAALLQTWNGLDQASTFGIRLRSTHDEGRELWAEVRLSEPDARKLDDNAAQFLTAVNAAMDSTVLATAQTVCTPLWPVEPELHRMPLTATAAEFETLVPAGQLLGLRPDQVRVLQQFQPWANGSPSARLIGTHMTHLAAGVRPDPGREFNAQEGGRRRRPATAAAA